MRKLVTIGVCAIILGTACSCTAVPDAAWHRNPCWLQQCRFRESRWRPQLLLSARGMPENGPSRSGLSRLSWRVRFQNRSGRSGELGIQQRPAEALKRALVTDKDRALLVTNPPAHTASCQNRSYAVRGSTVGRFDRFPVVEIRREIAGLVVERHPGNRANV